jgi:DNA invertase Pin-like site-specific DNA recombinase
MLNLMFSFAEFERELIQERILAGMAQQRRNIALGRYGRDIHSRTGKDMPPGRPRRVFRRDLAKEMKDAGMSYRQIAKELDVPYGTVFDAVAGRPSKQLRP